MNAPKNKSFDLEERLIAFACRVVRFVDRLPNTAAGRHLGGQLLRSGTAPALHYGEMQSAESLADFIHKLKLALKEQRESKNNLRIIEGGGLMPANDEDHAWLLKECLELIAILAKSVNTAEKNKEKRK